MWRSVLAVVLVPSMVWGQEQSLAVPEKQETVVTKDPQPADQALIEPRTIRPGKTKKAMLILLLDQGPVVSRNESSSDMVPLKLEFEESEGLTADSLTFPNEQRRNFAFHDEAMRKGELLEPPDDNSYAVSGNPLGGRGRLKIRDTRVRVLDGNSLRVNIKLKASKSADFGEHFLRANVTFQSIRDSGVLPPRQIEVQVPVRVIDQEPEAKSTKTAGNDEGGMPISMWILLPLLIPLTIVMAIVCGIRGEDCSC
ncbi:MAG TPA: hypothetical protein VE377_27545 [Candidatus Dormibacteraeota bacterium]|nr:hypothetical protein [Candidatus Dormibacteraeota bacterium]